MKQLRKIYYKIFKRYKVLETIFVSYQDGDKMIKDTKNCKESQQWVLADEEDNNRLIGMVYLCRKERIIE